MNAPLHVPRIPHIPAPPFEPDSLLLDGRAGWRIDPGAWKGLEEGPCGVLRLMQDEPGARQLTEASGSFGGLVPPSNVAIAGDGAVYLLDRAHHRLKRFDPCRCLFVEVPCIGGEGGAARQWRAPGGIAIGCGKLYVCDTGAEGGEPKVQQENHRVSVFSLGGLALYGHLAPPGAGGWRPVAVAVDPRGYAWVTDALNGMVHLFSPLLRFVRSFGGFANPGAITVDACGVIYVLCDAPPPVPPDSSAAARALRVVDADGREQAAPARIDAVACRFSTPAFGVDAKGRLDLRTRCIGMQGAPPPASLVFDEAGDPVLPEPAPVPVQFLTQGSAIIGPLDSKTHACIWHRIVLHGALPESTRIRVESFTADEIIPSAQLGDFARWDTGQLAGLFEQGRWDCLLGSSPGRYLWLQLSFLGDGRSTPSVEAIEIEFPRIGPRQYLPAVFGAEAGSADFTDRFLALFDTTWRGIERSVDTLPGLFDPLSTPAARVDGAPVDFLTWLASWVGLRFDRSWNEPRRRLMLKQAGRALDRRGTVKGLREALVLLLGLDRGATCVCADEPVGRCTSRPANCAPPAVHPATWQVPPLVLEHFRVRRWLFVGHGRLGERSMLWGQRIVNRSQLDSNARAGGTQLVGRPDPLHDPFHSHAHQFTVFVPSCVRDDDVRRKALENLLAAESPAHTRYYIDYVEPRFRIGVQSTLGFDAVIAAPPRTLALGEQPLGGGVLGPSARQGDAGRRWQAGIGGRIGVSSRIN